MIGFLFVLFVVIELYRRYVKKTLRYHEFSWNVVPGVVSIAWLFGTVMCWLIGIHAGYPPSRIAIQDTISASIMIILIFGVALSFKDHATPKETSWISIAKLSVPVLLSMTAIGLYQIVFAQTFAGVSLENGEYVRRACSFLFNPNVFGFWASLVIFFFSYAYHSRVYSNRFSVIMMIIAGLCIFMSGSRSSVLICLFFLSLSGVATYFSKNRRSRLNALAPMGSMAAATVVLFAVVKMADTAVGQSVSGIRNLSLLVDRFLSIPALLCQYGGGKISSSFPKLGSLIENFVSMPTSHQIIDLEKFQKSTPHAANVLQNIEYRLNPFIATADNGFIAVFEAGGWFGLVPWVLMWAALIWFGSGVYINKRDVNSGYALTAILGFAFSAFFMRAFQVFPFWVMVALCLGPALACIFRDTSTQSFGEETAQTEAG